MERSDNVKETIETVQRQEEEKQQKQSNNIVKNSFNR